MVVRIKPGVSVAGFRPEIVLALSMVMHIYQARGHNFRLTSGVEGKHSPTSLHPHGYAADVGVTQIDDRDEWPRLRDAIGAALGDQYDVVLEDAAAQGPHIHIEFDPKPKVVKV